MSEKLGRRNGNGSAGIPRRTFLKGTAAATGAVALSGISGIIAARQAPAYPKGTKLHLLQWLNFVPAGDKVFLEQAEEFGKQMGVKVMVERIGMNDVRAKTAGSIEAKSGPDICLIHNNQPHLFAAGLADVSDVAEAIGKEQGAFYDVPKAHAYTDRWIAIPQFGFAWAFTYREDWLKEAGYDKFPDTMDELRKFAREMKAKGRPIGQAFGHSENDPNIYCYQMVWSFGGYEVEADGKTVVLDSKGTLEAIKYNTALWKEGMDEGGLSWDDSSNNRAFVAGTISASGNSPSIYFAARQKFPDIYKVTNHAAWPKGPAGRFYMIATISSAVMKYSKNQKLAKEFITWYMSKPQYEKWFEAMETYAIPPTKMWYDHPLWERDPKTTVFRDVIKDARQIGYAGPPGRKASEAMAKYIIVDMFAKAIQGMSPEDALKWATAEMKKIYEA